MFPALQQQTFRTPSSKILKPSQIDLFLTICAFRLPYVNVSRNELLWCSHKSWWTSASFGLDTPISKHGPLVVKCHANVIKCTSLKCKHCNCTNAPSVCQSHCSRTDWTCQPYINTHTHTHTHTHSVQNKCTKRWHLKSYLLGSLQDRLLQAVQKQSFSKVCHCRSLLPHMTGKSFRKSRVEKFSHGCSPNLITLVRLSSLNPCVPTFVSPTEFEFLIQIAAIRSRKHGSHNHTHHPVVLPVDQLRMWVVLISWDALRRSNRRAAGTHLEVYEWIIISADEPWWLMLLCLCQAVNGQVIQARSTQPVWSLISNIKERRNHWHVPSAFFAKSPTSFQLGPI